MPDKLHQERKTSNFFDLDFELGGLKNRHPGKRMLALPLSSWVTLDSAMRQSFGEGAQTYMHQIGYSIGISIAQESIEKKKSSDSLEALSSSAICRLGKVQSDRRCYGIN